MTGATHRQLAYWARLGFVQPRARWGERFFTFSDLVAVETLHRLAQRHVPARRLRRAMDTLEQQLGRARAPLAALRISVYGTRIVVHEPGPEGRPLEPLSGQFVLDFETAPLEHKVRALGEHTAEEWFELGMSLDGNIDTLGQALDAYRHAVDGSPEWVEAHINLGTTLFQMARWQESMEAFSTAVALDASSALAHFNLGCICDRLGNTGRAVEEFQTAIALAPQMADAHLNLALACEKSGRKLEATRHFALYLRYEPQGPWADFARRRLDTKLLGGRGKVTPFRYAKPQAQR
jgi:tetratricopeptide (TPR) repeat protein